MSSKPRIIVTTDLAADPDDEHSLVRQWACGNESVIDGLLGSTGCWKQRECSTARLRQSSNTAASSGERKIDRARLFTM